MEDTIARLNTMTRVSGHMSPDKTRLIKNAMFLSQFDYCPLIWMFYKRELSYKING